MSDDSIYDIANRPKIILRMMGKEIESPSGQRCIYINYKLGVGVFD